MAGPFLCSLQSTLTLSSLYGRWDGSSWQTDEEMHFGKKSGLPKVMGWLDSIQDLETPHLAPSCPPSGGPVPRSGQFFNLAGCRLPTWPPPTREQQTSHRAFHCSGLLWKARLSKDTHGHPGAISQEEENAPLYIS